MNRPKPFRVALIINNLAASGAERVALNLADMFTERGHPVDLILLEERIEYTVSHAIPVHCLSRNRTLFKWLGGLGDWLLARRLKKRLQSLERQAPFGLILSHLPAADKVTARCKLPASYYCIHTDYSTEIAVLRQRGRYLRAARKRRQYKKTYSGKHLISVSRGIEADIRYGMAIPCQSLRTIYNPFNIEHIRQLASRTPPRLPSGRYILHAGAYRSVKRHDILVQAFSRLSHPIQLVLLSAPDPRLQALIQSAGLLDRVIIAGQQSNPYPYMKHAELLVVSSEREGLPTVMIESLICGTPVVSTDCPSGPREILQGTLADWLVPVNNPQALAERIDAALDASIQIDDTVIEQFSQDRVYRQYRTLASAEGA